MATHGAVTILGGPVFARRVPEWKQSLFGGWVRHRAESEIELTFDDGPNPNVTPAVLDLLAEFGVRATFFVVGRNVLRHRGLIRRIHAGGHRLGNHTLTHPRFQHWHWRPIEAEIRNCQHAIAEVTGVAPNEFRPPYGRLTPGVLLATRWEGLRVVNWSLDSGDWRCRDSGSAEACAEQTLRLRRRGDVVLLHDNHNWTVPILSELLPALAVTSAGRE